MSKYLYRVELVEYRGDGKPINAANYGEGDYIEVANTCLDRPTVFFTSVKLKSDSKLHVPSSSFGVKK